MATASQADPYTHEQHPVRGWRYPQARERNGEQAAPSPLIIVKGKDEEEIDDGVLFSYAPQSRR